MNDIVSRVVDENMLTAFRNEILAPEAILFDLRTHKYVNYRIALGVGKSVAVDRLLKDPATYEQYKRIVYIGPTKEIIKSRVPFTEGIAEPWVYLEARPRDHCADLDKAWQEYEKSSRSAQGKVDLCGKCPLNTGEKRCFWPRSLSKKISDNKLILLTESFLLEVPNLLEMIDDLDQEDPRTVLKIFDEATFVSSPLSKKMAAKDLAGYLAILQEMVANNLLSHMEEAMEWCRSLRDLLDATPDRLKEFWAIFPEALNFEAEKIQRFGSQRIRGFKFLGYQLVEFARAQRSELAKEINGDVHFMRRPVLVGDALFLNGFHSADFMRVRLGLPYVYSPFDRTRFLHTATRIYNIRDPAGADKRFPGNKKRILTFFQQLIAQNIQTGRTTMLIAKKDRTKECAEYLQASLKDHGHEVKIVYEKADLDTLGDPTPQVIPIINYGAIGSNRFEGYQFTFCLQSYNVAPEHVDDVVWDGVPRQYQMPRLDVRSDHTKVRRVKILNGEHHLQPHADAVLFDKELAVILQAAGRCRFYTKERVVIFFQQADFRFLLGPAVTEFQSLDEARQWFDVTDLKTLKRRKAGEAIKALLAQGKSPTDAAAACGLHLSTVYRLMKSNVEGRSS